MPDDSNALADAFNAAWKVSCSEQPGTANELIAACRAYHKAMLAAASLGAPPQGTAEPSEDVLDARRQLDRMWRDVVEASGSEAAFKHFCDRVRDKAEGGYGPFTNADWQAALTLRSAGVHNVSGSLSRETVERVNCGHGTAERVTVYHTGQGECLACRVAALTEKGDGNG